jgi:transglutaminase-like putative cysteine protease
MDGSQLPKGVLSMRKGLLILVAMLLTVVWSIPLSASAAELNWLDSSKLNQGVVTVQYKSTSSAALKVMITGNNAVYTYNQPSSGERATYPLQSGNGLYKVQLLQNTTGNKYKILNTATVELKLPDPTQVFLDSVQNVNWSAASKAVQKAAELTKGKNSDEDKVTAIYQYIVANIKYDAKLAKTQTSEYIPDVDQVLTSKSATCYGYASLFGVMLRSVHIPAKLVMGTSAYVTEYHAWNEVYLKGKWVLIDTTVDAGLKNSKSMTMIKDPGKYKAAKYY